MKPAPDPAEPWGAGRHDSSAKPAQQFIIFRCPNCDKRIGFPPDLANTVAVCLACRIRVMVPRNADEESFVVCNGALAPPSPRRGEGNGAFALRSPGRGDGNPAFPTVAFKRPHAEPVMRGDGPHQGAKVLGVAAACVAAVVLVFGLVMASLKNRVATRGGSSDAAVSVEAPSQDAELPPSSAPDAPSGAVATRADEPARPVAPANGAAEPPASLPGGPSSSKNSAETVQTPPAAPRDEAATATIPAAPTATGPVELFNQPAVRMSVARRGDDDEAAPAAPQKSSAAIGPGAAGAERDGRAGWQPAPQGPGAEKDAVVKALDPIGMTAERPSAAMRIAPRVAEPAERCPQCLGSGHVPISPGHVYIHFAKDPIPNVLEAVPWGYCPRCQPKANSALLIQAEAQRLRDDKAKANQQNYEQTSKLKILRAETQHVTLYMQLAEPFQREGAKPPVARPGETRRVEDRTHNELKDVGTALEQLKIHLELATRTTVLTQARPDTHEMLILWDVPSYNIAIDGLLTQSGADDKVLARKAAGVSGRHRSFFNSYLGEPAIPRPPKHMALFMLGQMLMQEAIGGKALPWLVEGFGAYCEHAVTKQNLCYSFEYELNEIRFGANWDADMRRVARETRLKPWRQIFSLDLAGARPADYLSFYSMVSFLMTDAPRFALFTLEVRNGTDCATALEKSFGRKLEDLQATWANWVVR